MPSTTPGRLPFGVRAEPLGYVIEGGGRSVYFAGDTDVFDEMAELAPVDVALLPIWGWGPTMGPGHMDPARAPPRRPALLGARVAIPIHWGTYYPIHLGLRGPPGFLTTPPALFEQAVRERAPGTEVRVLRPGESHGDVRAGRVRRSRRNASHPACTDGCNPRGPERSSSPARRAASSVAVGAGELEA